MNKVLKNVLIITCVILFAIGISLYIIFPTEFKDTLALIKDFVNQPLPIVGVSLVTILIFIWRCFVASKYGKKALNELRKENEQLRKENNDFKNETNCCIVELKNQIADKDKTIARICELSTNQKIKAIGKELLGYGKETVDGQPKEE